MSVWKNIRPDALASVFIQVQAFIDQNEELTRIVAEATLDRLASLTPAEAARRKKLAKKAKQTLHNYRGSDASLAQEEKARRKALSKLLFDNKGPLGDIAKVVVEASILSAQIDEIATVRAEVEAEAKPQLKAQERAWLDAFYKAGGSLWQLRQLSKSDLVFLATFAREKAEDPRHRDQNGLAMTAFRDGHLELCVEGLTEAEQTALLLASGRITAADIEAKKAFEMAAGHALAITPTLAGALARAAEIQRAGGDWNGAIGTVDHAENAAFERDLQTLVEAIGSGEKAEARAWDILLPPTPLSIDAVPDAAASPALCATIAREMLDHIHGAEQDRWATLMDKIGHDMSQRQTIAERIGAAENDNLLIRDGAQNVLLASDWRAALQRLQDDDVRSLAKLVRDQPEVRWLAQCRGIDVPATLTIEPPFLHAARLLRQPVDELVWELFDPPPSQENTSGSVAGSSSTSTARPADNHVLDDDDDY